MGEIDDYFRTRQTVYYGINAGIIVMSSIEDPIWYFRSCFQGCFFLYFGENFSGGK